MSEMQLIKSESSTIDVKGKCFNFIIDIYKVALTQIFQELEELKEKNEDVISNVTKRIKEPKSIINKMRKKHYEINYTNLIDNIEDIAGIRIICPLKEDIYTVIRYLRNIPNINIIKEKDYITKPKKSGYSAYHVITETPVIIENKEVLVKVEIQIRTMAMDFWATNEHDVRYKTNKKISILDSKRLSLYAKIINVLDDRMVKINRRQRFKEVAYR